MNIESIKRLSSITFQLFLFLGSFSLIWSIIGEQDLLWQVLLSLTLYLIILAGIQTSIRTIQQKHTFLRSILAILYIILYLTIIISMVFGCFVLYIFYNISSAQIPPGKIIFGDNFTLSSGEKLNDDLVVFGGNATIEEDARLNGNLLVIGGTIKSNGETTGDVVVVGGQVNLEKSAVVTGDLVTIGGQLERAEGAKIEGEVVNHVAPDFYVPPGRIPPTVPSAPAPSNSTVNVILLVATALTALLSAISGTIAQFTAHKKTLADIEIEKQKLALERDKFELEKSKSQPKPKSKSHK